MEDERDGLLAFRLVCRGVEAECDSIINVAVNVIGAKRDEYKERFCGDIRCWCGK